MAREVVRAKEREESSGWGCTKAVRPSVSTEARVVGGCFGPAIYEPDATLRLSGAW